MPPSVDDLQPLAELVVEIAGTAERSARQKRPLEIVVGPFDDALVFRFTRLEHHHLGAQHPAKRLAFPGQLK